MRFKKRQEVERQHVLYMRGAPPLFLDLRDSRGRFTAIVCSFGALADEFASSSSELLHVAGPFA